MSLAHAKQYTAMLHNNLPNPVIKITQPTPQKNMVSLLRTESNAMLLPPICTINVNNCAGVMLISSFYNQSRQLATIDTACIQSLCICMVLKSHLGVMAVNDGRTFVLREGLLVLVPALETVSCYNLLPRSRNIP